MISRTIFAIILTLECLTTRAGAVALISVDASNCREFTAVEKNKLAPYDRTASWIFGFLSGVATAGNRDVLRGLDPTAIVDWISNYCRQNPNDYWTLRQRSFSKRSQHENKLARSIVAVVASQ